MPDTVLAPPAPPAPAAPAPAAAAPPAAPPASPPASPPEPPAAPAVEAEWIKSAARGDDKRAEKLARFTDPGAIYDALEHTQKALHDSGKVRIPDAKATDEDREAFRKLSGVPETHEGYKIPKEIADKLDDEDRAVLSMVTQHAHKSGGIMSHPEVVKGVHEAYLLARDEATAQMVANAEAKHEECQAALQKEWGGEFKRNIGFASSVLKRYGGAEAGELLKLPMADGTRLGDYAPLVRMLAKVGLEVGDDPVFAEASRSGGDALETMEAEKAKIMALREAGKFKEYDAKAGRLAELDAAIARHGQKR